jgi:hypothetical protein
MKAAIAIGTGVAIVVGGEILFRETTGKLQAQGSDFGGSQRASGTGVTAAIFSVGSYPLYALDLLLIALESSLTDEQYENRVGAFAEAFKYFHKSAPIDAPDMNSWPVNIKRASTKLTGACRREKDCRLDYELYTGRITR